MALLLALDVSSSVDAEEDALQRRGLARALSSQDVQAAILSVPGQSVALAVYEWSGRYQQFVTLDWRLLSTSSDILTAAADISGSRRPHREYPTAIGYAIGYAAALFAKAPPCQARTLDVSGDGKNNEGFPPRLAYANFPLEDVTVNGLTIGGQSDDLAGYYLRELIRGPGAFVEEASDFADFERAMQRKLVRETRALAIGMAPLAGAGSGG
ncbi:DUF1194 domain-containing protein [Candidatus Rhodobacter oscarellae]|uniref:DUF1194 domain-containing protein n=1 Tax=Candidatus Rhodobacter oscarellae TaxID=1675527 RepID=UPI002E13BB41